jgi:hypothetical protein
MTSIGRSIFESVCGPIKQLAPGLYWYTKPAGRCETVAEAKREMAGHRNAPRLVRVTEHVVWAPGGLSNWVTFYDAKTKNSEQEGDYQKGQFREYTEGK